MLETIRTSIRRATVTRPADTTTYAANEHVSTAAGASLQFAPSTPLAHRAGKVISGRLWKSGTGVTADGFTLRLFQQAPAAAPVDNAAATIVIADVDAFVGLMLFDATGIVLGDGVYYESAASTLLPVGGIPFQSPGSSDILYGILITQGAYQPASAEVFTVTLEIQH